MRIKTYFVILLLITLLLAACSEQSSVPDISSPGSGGKEPSSRSDAEPKDTAGSEPLEYPVTIRIVGLEGEYLLEDLVIDGSGYKNAGEAVAAACAEAGLNIKSSGSGSFFYISSIGSLAERQHGPGSGWVFFHNGVYSTNSAGSIRLEASDRISFYYSLNLGADVQDLENP